MQNHADIVEHWPTDDAGLLVVGMTPEAKKNNGQYTPFTWQSA
jgi:hypothetical protein